MGRQGGQVRGLAWVMWRVLRWSVRLVWRALCAAVWAVLVFVGVALYLGGV